jgi:hypothetical protein
MKSMQIGENGSTVSGKLNSNFLTFSKVSSLFGALNGALPNKS